MKRVAVVLLTIRNDNGTTNEYVLVLENVQIEDRPAAVGHFLLAFIDDYNIRYGKSPDMRVRIGRIAPDDLKARTKQWRGGAHDGNVNVYTTGLSSTEFGEVYRMVTAVERGDKSIFRD